MPTFLGGFGKWPEFTPSRKVFKSSIDTHGKQSLAHVRLRIEASSETLLDHRGQSVQHALGALFCRIRKLLDNTCALIDHLVLHGRDEP